LGWGEGNRKLKDVATGLQKVFRRSVDIIGRVGSDEFVVLSLNAKKDPNSAELILSRLHEALPADVQVNMIAGWYGKEVDPKTAISEAKEAITTAKRNGPLDGTGRSLGYGLAKTGEYVE
jgi:GGDEF domain-containing protein